jgi:hypothetical protein
MVGLCTGLAGLANGIVVVVLIMRNVCGLKSGTSPRGCGVLGLDSIAGGNGAESVEHSVTCS